MNPCHRKTRSVTRALISGLLLAHYVVSLQAAEGIIPAGAKVSLVARAQAVETTPFTEGPAYYKGQIYFTDVSNSRILRMDLTSSAAKSKVGLQVHREASGRANGLAFDGQGRLLACEGSGIGGTRRVTRTEKDGTITVMADRYQGKRFNSPNDLTVDKQGRIYFTDPRYGDRTGVELDKEAVYRIDAPGKVVRIIADVERPNGIAVSPEGHTLYVVDNNPEKNGSRKVYAYELRPNGSAGERRVVYNFGTGRGGDGMSLDTREHLYVAAGLNASFSPSQDSSVNAGIYVISPAGKMLEFIPVPEDSVTNCTFGDNDLKTLYITAGTALWKIRLNVAGTP